MIRRKMMLTNKNLLKTEAYINGQWTAADSGETYPVLNPADRKSVV